MPTLARKTSTLSSIITDPTTTDLRWDCRLLNKLPSTNLREVVVTSTLKGSSVVAAAADAVNNHVAAVDAAVDAVEALAAADLVEEVTVAGSVEVAMAAEDMEEVATGELEDMEEAVTAADIKMDSREFKF
jgi:hypothetical protein